ncbi:MAG: hypothetical protein JO209_02025 [Acidisphaera sp.]|nr:hypothetical protein [Acidisphaera sp.]
MLRRFFSEFIGVLRALTIGYILYFLVGIAALIGSVFGHQLGLPRILVGLFFTVLAMEAAVLWFVIDLLRMRGRRLQ